MSDIQKEPGKEPGMLPTDASDQETEKKKREYKDFGHDQEGPTSPSFYFQYYWTILTLC